ncbi:MAG: glycosyltransferase [Nitrospira sp. CG24E]|nr:MAG: glycosyltransferase [Nitrospira sp. CG24E]
MRIALINSPSLSARPVSRSMAGGLGFDGNEDMLLPPLDLAIMAATLRQIGETVDLIDADPLGLDPAAVYARLEGHWWDVVVGTVSLPTLDQDALFLAELRRRHPAARIIGKTLVRDHGVLRALLERSAADLVIHGEADLTIADLVYGRGTAGTAWLEAGAPGTVPSFRFDEGAPVEDLNQLPFPARDLLPNARYIYPLLGTPVATLQTSRGCPYPCGYYCPYPLVEGVKWRSQTPERIFAELKDVVERQGITKIYFRDATFTLNQERVARLCDLIVAAGWRIEWVCETRVDCLGDSLLEKMREAGCVGLLVGVETGDEQVMHLREGKKGLTIPMLAHLREKTCLLGIRLHFLLIVGLPQETRESLVATYDLIQRYKPDTIGVTIITPYPGTALHAEGIREGWIDSHQYKDYGGHQIPMHTPNLTRADMEAGKQFLEEGFAILQKRQVGGHSKPLEAMAQQHYEQLLRWAYHLDRPVAQLREVLALAPTLPQPRKQSSATSVPLPVISLARCSLSVVIPTYNRRAILRKTLLALMSQTFASEQFEVVVVDDGSSDDTVAMLRQFKAPFALRVLAAEHAGANAARNLGIRAAQGRVVLITGDDMIPEPSFLEAHATFHERHPSEMDAMLGFIDWSPEIAVTPFMKFIVSAEGGQQFAFHEVREGKADFRLFYTSNLSVKRDLLLNQPVLFDQDFTYPAYDDVELGYRLSVQGLQLHYNAMAVTCHHHEITLAGFVQRQRKAGHMAVVLARKHPELSRTYLKIDDALNSRHALGEAQVARVMQVAQELEKPDLQQLALIRSGAERFDRTYLQRVLHPVYQTLLQSAYAWGICEAVEQGVGAIPSVIACASPKPRFKASIVIPVFNKLELTSQCLATLASLTTMPEYEVIVVDNASTDGTAEFLAALGGDVQVIRNPENYGFAVACNQGAKAARGEFLLFLNNDTIPTEGWLNALVDEVERHPDVAVVGSKLLYEDGTIQHAGVAFSRIWFSPYHIYKGFPADAPVVNRRREFQCVTAACMLARREVFESVGGFDDGYRNGFEDVDLCLKIGERGWKIVYQPKSVLYHLESQTPGRKAHERENSKRLLARWGHKWWLADEDMIYVPDGYAYRTVTKQQGIRGRLEPLTDPEEKRRWKIAADAQIAAQRQDLSALKELLARVEEWPADEWVLQRGAWVCRWIGESNLAEGFWRRVLSQNESQDARIALARFALEQGQVEQADSHVNILLSNHAQQGEGWLLRGIIAMQRQEFDAASLAFQKALDYGGDPRKARMGQRMAAAGLGQSEGAWTAFSEVLDRDPDDAEAAHWLLRAGTMLEQWEKLVGRLQRFLSRNPGDLSLRFALAGVFLRLNRWAEARHEYDSIRLLDPAFDGLSELVGAIDENESVLTHHHAAR